MVTPHTAWSCLRWDFLISGEILISLLHGVLNAEGKTGWLAECPRWQLCVWKRGGAAHPLLFCMSSCFQLRISSELQKSWLKCPPLYHGSIIEGCSLVACSLTGCWSSTTNLNLDACSSGKKEKVLNRYTSVCETRIFIYAFRYLRSKYYLSPSRMIWITSNCSS